MNSLSSIYRMVAIGLVAATFIVGVGACGIPRDSAPNHLALPDDLAGREVRTVVDSNATDFPIYMLDENSLLYAINRTLTRTPEGVMDALIDGTELHERQANITTALTRATDYSTIDVNPEFKTAYVDLIGDIRSIARGEQELAFAQIVYSLTGLGEQTATDGQPTATDIDSVVFSLNGQRLSIPTDRGSIPAGQPVTRADFSSRFPQAVGFDAGNSEDAPVDSPTEQTPTPSPIPVGAAEGPVTMPVWMLDVEGFLYRVPRLVDQTPEAIADALKAGPFISETPNGIWSALPQEAVFLTIDVDDQANTAFVDLGPASLPPIVSEDRLRAVAQIVFSLTELRNVNDVIISIDGVREPMPTTTGQTDVDAPRLTRADFAGLALDVVGVPAPTPTGVPTPTAGAEDAEESN